MTTQINTIEAKTFIGMKQETSLVNDKTQKLFKTFMPRRNEITSSLNNHIYDLKEYPKSYFQQFSPTREFKKWALVEVLNTDFIPEKMEVFHLSSGKYAQFNHTGSFKDNSPFEYIYGEWLAKSDYELDDRPHFDIMNTTNKKEEQEIWIPIK